jgi:hypothetical protein
MMYHWNEEVYRFVKDNPHMIAWQDFATDKASIVFGDYHCICNPYLFRGSKDHIFWQKYFNNYFKCKRTCTFPFITRLINSIMITGATPILP